MVNAFLALRKRFADQYIDLYDNHISEVRIGFGPNKNLPIGVVVSLTKDTNQIPDTFEGFPVYKQLIVINKEKNEV